MVSRITQVIAPVAPWVLASSCRSHSSSSISPWLTPMAYVLLRYGIMPTYFKSITVIGQNHLPKTGAVILAPTHRSRWDALVIAYVAGRHVTGRDVRFMVTVDEMQGLQGWLIRQLGGFSINPRQPAIASLRFGLDILKNKGVMAIFPEGTIFRDRCLHTLKPGFARLAIQAEGLYPWCGIQIVPMDLIYGDSIPSWGTSITVKIGVPISVQPYCSQSTALESCKYQAQKLTEDLADAFVTLGLQGVEDAK